MSNFHRCAAKAWNILFSISVFTFVAVSLDITQARVLPFIWSQTNVYTFGRKPGTDGSVDFDQIGGSRSVLEKFNYIEVLKNGTVILRSTMESDSNQQNLLLFKSVIGAMKRYPEDKSSTKWNIKIYGEGVEHKLPPFLERIIQRIQTYFSIYKYTDTSAVEISSVNPIQKDENINNGSIISNDKSDFEQPHTILGVASTPEEDNNESAEFIPIDEHDVDFKVGNRT